MFLVGGGLRFVPERIAPAIRSMVFCSLIWEARAIKGNWLPSYLTYTKKTGNIEVFLYWFFCIKFINRRGDLKLLFNFMRKDKN